MDFSNMTQLLEEKKYLKLKDELKDGQSFDIAEFIDSLDEKQALLAFRLLPKGVAADVFSYLSIDRQAEISDLVNEKELADILSDLYFDDKVDLLEEMPANVIKKILKHTNDVERKLINQFLMYPDDSAGSLMTIEFVDLKKEMTVSDALDRIRRHAPNRETIYTCYVMDEARHLEGTISLKDLVLLDVDTKISEVMKVEPVFVKTHDHQEYIADVFKNYDLIAAPVVDNEQRLVGIITIDDIVDVMEKEATEDFHRMAAIEPFDDSYLNTSILVLAKKRIGWLLLLMVSATLTGLILSKYELALESVVALTFFIPMLMDTGGNAGSQASTLVIRSITLGEVKFKDIFRVISKEIGVSIIVGLALCSHKFLRIWLIQGYDLAITLTVTITLFFTVLMAKVIGGILPILADKAKLDPAIMASPLITTIVDTFALLIYFSVATVFLKI